MWSKSSRRLQARTEAAKMSQRIYWIESGAAGRLAILARPAPERISEEVAAWRDAGVTTVASLLEPEEQRALGLRAEAELCRAHGIDFAAFPIPDRGIPASLEGAVALARRLAHTIEAGGTVGVHCHACIGRSGMIAAAVLMALGRSEHQALELVAAGRGLRVPETPEQRAWVKLAARESAPRSEP
jgi:protein-tyrosine phosphatase